MVQLIEKKDEALGLELKAKLEGGKILLEGSADLAKLVEVADQKIDAGSADGALSVLLQILAGVIKAA